VIQQRAFHACIAVSARGAMKHIGDQTFRCLKVSGRYSFYGFVDLLFSFFKQKSPLVTMCFIEFR
jgi:hypothetical protein